ncbi:MAG TPA: FliM/FliN family flagellar motor switch protein [Bryobacteraceae bacterium]|jgi:flagellar motor switch protein FliN/FliY|nr:FliM/FliN family flagellar motor switch protein [Bryobacteraceae bacterium]
MNESNESLEQTEKEPTQSEPEAETSVFSGATPASSGSHAGSLLLGVKLPIRVLLGRTQLCLKDVAQLGNGSVVELDCSPSDPVEVIVNDKIIAHGEVVVVGGNYGVRITRIAGATDPGGPAEQRELLNLSEGLRG